jgi:hypothetical protein
VGRAAVGSTPKYLLAALVTAAVAALAVFVAVNVELLAGAVVVLGALVIVALVGRMRASRAEKAGMADWKDVLDADAPADAFFGEWTRTAPSATPQAPDMAEPAWAAAGDDVALAPAVESGPVVDLADGDEPASELPDQTEVVSTAVAPTGTPIDGELPDTDLIDTLRHDEPAASALADPASSPFPFEDDGFGDLVPDAEVPSTGGDERGIEVVAVSPGTDAPYDSPFDVPGADLADYFTSSDADADAPEFADELTVTVSTGSTDPSAGATDRRPLIDWTGPTRIVEDRVRTSDDILAASAATALPTATVDRPAPAAGSELARLLSKVEARLRDY